MSIKMMTDEEIERFENKYTEQIEPCLLIELPQKQLEQLAELISNKLKSNC